MLCKNTEKKDTTKINFVFDLLTLNFAAQNIEAGQSVAGRKAGGKSGQRRALYFLTGSHW